MLSHKVSNLLVASKLLMIIIARKCQHGKAIRPILILQLLELRKAHVRLASGAGRIDNKRHFAVELIQHGGSVVSIQH
jgi:hypothetical protein